MTTLIDGDSIIYVVAYHHRDSFSIEDVLRAVDTYVESILQATEATHYIGALSHSTNFRYSLYKYDQYKGNRPESPDYMKQWKKIIVEHLCTKWKFIIKENLEADDIVSAYSYLIPDCIIASPDKDLKQLVGTHYNYMKKDGLKVVTEQEAARFFWFQMLTGDTSDNVKGVTGIGEIKANKLLDSVVGIDYYTSLRDAVYEQYLKAFGKFYGVIIFKETYQTLKLIHPESEYWGKYDFDLSCVNSFKYEQAIDERTE